MCWKWKQIRAACNAAATIWPSLLQGWFEQLPTTFRCEVIAPVNDTGIRVPLCVPLSLKLAAFLFGRYGWLTIWALFGMETFTFDLLTLELSDFRSRRPCPSLASFLAIILRLLRPSTLYLGPGTGQTDRQTDRQTDKETTAINALCPACYVGGNTIMQWYEQSNVHCADSPSGDFTYIPSVNGSYKVLKQNLDWSAAGLACRQLHRYAHLLVINDEQEQLAVARMLRGLSVTFLYYIAFYCEKCAYVYLSLMIKA